ncbi:unnamed protein product [Durusdinium trenchii]|uniref:Uncharacterized protein n=2 Tax=Durusdinium trenchii TaxID=1381693 RepID=A0ABP0N4P4_9DINO
MRPDCLGFHVPLWLFLTIVILPFCDSLVTVNRTRTDHNLTKAAPDMPEPLPASASFPMIEAVLHAQRPVSAVAEDKSSQPEQQDLPGPPPLRKLHFHMFTLMVCGFLIIGAQRLAYRQSQSDASPGDPLAYVFKARQLQQSEGIRGRL